MMATATNPQPPTMFKGAARLRLNLRMIASVDFRIGVPTHYEELKRRKLLRDIRDDETILLISHTGRQLAFVFYEIEVRSRSGEPVKAIAHYRIQLDRHTPWNHLMLSEYAKQAGIDLVHVKRFEDHLLGLDK